MCLCVMACVFMALVYYAGVFGDKWQKRYFILNGPVLNYFKKYGVRRGEREGGREGERLCEGRIIVIESI